MRVESFYPLCLFLTFLLYKIEDAFGSHVEQQVENAEVGQEAGLLLIHLVIAVRHEVGIGCGMLGIDSRSEVGEWCRLEGWRDEIGCQSDRRMNVDEFAHFYADGLVEIEQKRPSLLKERAQVIGIVFKERGVAVGRLQGLPVHVAPVAVVADECILHAMTILERDWHGEGLHPLGGGNETAVAEGLFGKGLVLFYQHLIIAIKLLIPLHRTKISGG